MSFQKLHSIKTGIVLLLAITVLVVACKKDDDAPPAPPSNPTGLTFTDIKAKSFTAKWTAPSDVTNFLLYVATDTGFTKPVAGFNPKAVTGNSQVVDKLQKTTKYYVKLQSFKDGVKSDGVTASETTKDVDVFVGGYQVVSNFLTPTYWKNGNAVNINPANPGDYIAKGIFVSNDDVYLVGSQAGQTSSTTAPVYWKNGTLVTLPYTAFSGSTAQSIFVSGNDVYVAGHDGNSRATYWKNGNKIDLGMPTNYSWAYSIFVSGADAYVAGYESNGTHHIAKYWKNSAPISLTDGTKDAFGMSVFVAGNDVYVAGAEFNTNYTQAKYWKNGAPVVLSNGPASGFAYSVFVEGSDVYVAGADSVGGGKNVAMLWKNGVATPLSDGTRETWAVSVFVVDGDVHVAGYEYNSTNYIAKYWKNGNVVNLTTPAVNGRAYGVFVR